MKYRGKKKKKDREDNWRKIIKARVTHGEKKSSYLKYVTLESQKERYEYKNDETNLTNNGQLMSEFQKNCNLPKVLEEH